MYKRDAERRRKSVTNAAKKLDKAKAEIETLNSKVKSLEKVAHRLMFERDAVGFGLS